MLLLLWGSNIIDRTCHTAYCGAFSRWYFSVEGLPLIDSLHVATTTSFGSVCFGGCVGASIKVLYQTARPLQKMAGVGNCVGSVITCIFDMIIGCTGDLIEYFDDWVYAQCAVRGTSFCVSARSSYALIACNGLPTVITDLLLDFVLLPASTLSGLVGLSVAVAGDASSLLRRPEELQSIDIASGLTGLVGGFIGAGIVLRFFSSGSKSILLCWAENPIPLHEEHEFEHLHTELTAKIRDAEMSWHFHCKVCHLPWAGFCRTLSQGKDLVKAHQMIKSFRANCPLTPSNPLTHGFAVDAGSEGPLAENVEHVLFEVKSGDFWLLDQLWRMPSNSHTDFCCCERESTFTWATKSGNGWKGTLEFVWRQSFSGDSRMLRENTWSQLANFALPSPWLAGLFVDFDRGRYDWQLDLLKLCLITVKRCYSFFFVKSTSTLRVYWFTGVSPIQLGAVSLAICGCSKSFVRSWSVPFPRLLGRCKFKSMLVIQSSPH